MVRQITGPPIATYLHYLRTLRATNVTRLKKRGQSTGVESEAICIVILKVVTKLKG